MTDTFLKGIGDKGVFEINNKLPKMGPPISLRPRPPRFRLQPGRFEEIRFFSMGDSDEAAVKGIESRLQGEGSEIAAFEMIVAEGTKKTPAETK